MRRLIELINEYGVAKFGDAWWPGNAGPWIGDDKGTELAALIDNVDKVATDDTQLPTEA
ncbi:hypothetical protein [Actinophytocola sp.]|uniref:hypothetical protein n=1 Tax=Actinophytocola sp. TaxID=1872138 RepID=UPI002D7F19BA|nr:hypothetical protein [Actinophytocola sp.]HET9144027.1 hypothetical protein [Actinophytocola sp.]